MSGFFGTTQADQVATWVAALATIVVLGGLLGERRVFGWSQHLLAGLATGFLALLAITEVLAPRIVSPLLADAGGRPELWLGLLLVAAAAAVPWLPRVVSGVPLSITIGTLAAFGLGGAVVGTLLPQLAATVAGREATLTDTVVGVAAAGVSGLVLIGFVHGTPRGRVVSLAAIGGRWLMLAGLGGWLGYLLFSRLVLLVDRVAFLVGDWLGLAR
ncbi:MAG TPA: hypothetical protein VJ975_10460 [Candidatus Limnocylindria bacterium]|nr:hypothetical protein [Candidatus Limnocylindria bacterium]